MARPKSPKKNNNDVNQAVSPSTEASISHPVESPVEGVAAANPITQVTKPKNGRNTRKPEIVRAEPRTNLVPINMDDEIRRLAYLLSERRGFEPGHETEDWLSAEREILGRYEQRA